MNRTSNTKHLNIIEPVDDTAEQKLATIARLLDLPDEDALDADAIKAAIDELFAPVSDEVEASIRRLSLREIALCKSKRVRLSAYAATRAATLARRPR